MEDRIISVVSFSFHIFSSFSSQSVPPFLLFVENILNFTLNRFSLIKEKSDTCLDSSGPSVLVTTKPIWDSCKEFKKRGIRHRLITEITSQNIDYCKELMRHTDELRHLWHQRKFLS